MLLNSQQIGKHFQDRIDALEDQTRQQDDAHREAAAREIEALQAALQQAQDETSNERAARIDADTAARKERDARMEAQARLKVLEDERSSLLSQLDKEKAQSGQLHRDVESAQRTIAEGKERHAKVEGELQKDIESAGRALAEAKEMHAKTERWDSRDTINELQQEIEEAEMERSKLRVVVARRAASPQPPNLPNHQECEVPAFSVRSAPSFVASLG